MRAVAPGVHADRKLRPAADYAGLAKGVRRAANLAALRGDVSIGGGKKAVLLDEQDVAALDKAAEILARCAQQAPPSRGSVRILSPHRRTKGPSADLWQRDVIAFLRCSGADRDCIVEMFAELAETYTWARPALEHEDVRKRGG